MVDDEESLLDLFAEALTEAGHSVRTAPDLRKALALMETEPFDVVVSDINMPGPTGLDLLARVRERDPDLPVIFVTGNPTLESAIQALERGALHYMLKPVALDTLQKGVTRALGLRKVALLKRQALEYLRAHPIADIDGRLETDLTRALRVLWLAYQPIVRAQDASLFAYEALVRSDYAALSSPETLLGAAESLGRMFEVGRAVRAALAASIEQQALGSADAFVNLHALDLTDDSLLSPDAPLSRWAPRVVFEITERAALDGVPDARARVRTLRQLGFRIALDDLGAGYSGLGALAALEPEIVKLDLSLVRGAHAEPVKRRLVTSLVSACKDLGILVVAEGIENDQDREVLAGLGCDFLQGFLFGRPARR